MNFQNQIDYLQLHTTFDMFDACTVPAPLILEDVETAIVIRCGLLEPVYSEPEMMRRLTQHWFKVNQWIFEHLINIILAEYSPIENTDRYTSSMDEKSGENISTQIHSGTDARSITNGGTDTETETHSGIDTTENTISAWNTSGYQSDNKSELTHGEQIVTGMQHGHTVADSLQHGHQIAVTGSDEGITEHTEHTHGNIGVTTNQELINQELELLKRFNIYDWIAAKYEREMMLQIY